MTESLLSNNTPNRFKFIMAPTREKIKDCRQHALATCAK